MQKKYHKIQHPIVIKITLNMLGLESSGVVISFFSLVNRPLNIIKITLTG